MVEFDEVSHTYTVAGVKYPSVTTVIKEAGFMAMLHFSPITAGTGVHLSIKLFNGIYPTNSTRPLLIPYYSPILTRG